VQVTRLVSLVAQKFLSDVAYEALQHCKMRGGGKELKKVSGRDRKFTLASEDLLVALADQGVRLKKPPFYSN
jgi:transcription initiation factor TFIID subunit 10